MLFRLYVFLFLFFSSIESYAGRLYVDLAGVDFSTNADETPCSKKSACAAEGVRLLISFDRRNDGDEDLLWRSEVMFVPKSTLRRAPAPKVFEEDSAIRLRYFLYGGAVAEAAKGVYLDYFGLDHTYRFPSLDEGDLRYEKKSTDLAVPEATRLFRFTLNRDAFSISNLIGLIEGFKGGRVLPKYCAKGFTTGFGAHDVLNCMTFAVRFMERLGIGLRNDIFIANYLDDTGGWRKIAYPERFLESFSNICMINGGIAYRENISDIFNSHYYNNQTFRVLLEPDPSPQTKVNRHMIIRGDPSADRRSLGEKSLIKGEVGSTVVVGVSGIAVGGGSLLVGGTVATEIAAAVGVAGTLATGASIVGTSALGLIGVTTTAVAGPVVLGGLIVGGGVGAVGYGTYRIGKRILNWF